MFQLAFENKLLELQIIVNSGRRSIVQRNEGHCSHFNETSNDITRVHSSHLGPDSCVRRARDVLFWLSIVRQIKKRVQNCEVCNYFLARQQKEPAHFARHSIPDMITDNGPNMQAISSPLSHENGNFSTLPVRHYTITRSEQLQSRISR